MSANIEIGISLILKEDSAVPAVANLVKMLKELDKVYTGMADPLKALTRETIEGTSEQQRAIQGIVNEVNALIGVEKKVGEMSSKVWVSSNEDVRKFVGGMLKANQTFRDSKESVAKLADSFGLNSTQMNFGLKLVDKYTDASDRLGISASDLHNSYIKIAGAEKERALQTNTIKKQMDALRFADKLSVEEAKDLGKEFFKTGEEAQNYARGLRIAEEAQSRQLIRSQQLRASSILLKDTNLLEGKSLKFVADTYGVSTSAIQSYQVTLQKVQEIKMKEKIINTGVANTLFLLSNYTKIHDETTRKLIHTLAGGEQQAKAYASTLQQLAENQKLNATYNRLMAGSMTPLQRIAKQTSRELFWTGLGMMFTTMALARAMRNMRQANREATQLAITNINIRRSQEDYNETLREYGASSEEAREAGYQLRLMQLRQKEQIENVRSSLQQQNLAYVMLIFGMFPTMMRTGALVTETLRGIQVAHLASADATMKDVIAKNIAGASTDNLTAKTNLQSLATMYDTSATTLSTGSKIGSAGASNILGMALSWTTIKTMAQVIATQLLIGALTLGVGVAISFAASMYFADQSMKEMKRRSKELESELYGGSLYDALYKVTEVTKDLRNEMDRVKFPKVTEMKVIGIREVEELEVENQTQRITQILEPVSIERIPDQIYNISAIMGDIPKIEDKKQLIIQELREVDIPLTKNQRMSITQELLEVDIKEPEDLEQEIIQILVKSAIPIVDNQVQTITQELSEVEIPNILDKEQRINQILEEIRIPIPDNISQTITQRLIETEIEKPDDVIHVIEQVLIEKEIPLIDNQTQNIYQKLISVNIPDIEDKIQLISQILNEVDIEEIEDKTQYVDRRLREKLPELSEELIQIVIQEIVEADIEIEDREQIIRQRLIEASIPNIRDIRQRITQTLERVEIEEPDNMNQIINQILKPIEIKDVEDKTYNLSAIVDIPTIPDIPAKTFKIEGIVTRGTDRLILDMENKLTDFNRKIEINKIPGILETSNINVRHEIPELERGINMEPTRDIRTNNYVNVSFPNLIIREEADIYKIRNILENMYKSGMQGRGYY